MQKLKTPFKFKDKQAGFKYTAIAFNKTHYLAIDKMGEQVLVNKTQVIKEAV